MLPQSPHGGSSGDDISRLGTKAIVRNSQLAAEHPEKPHLDEDNSTKPTQASDKAAQAEY